MFFNLLDGEGHYLPIKMLDKKAFIKFTVPPSLNILFYQLTFSSEHSVNPEMLEEYISDTV